MSSATHRLAVVTNDIHARRAFYILIVGAVFISFAPIFVRLSTIGMLPTAFWRAVLAVPGLVIAAAMTPNKRNLRRTPARASDVGWFAVAGFMFAGDLGTWHFAIQYTSVADATLFPNTAPIFVAIFSFALFGTRFAPKFLFGMAIALIGVTLLLGLSINVDHEHLVGDALGLSTAMFYAGYFLAVARLRGEYTTPCVMAGTMIFTALFLAPAAWLAGTPALPASAAAWLPLIGLALLSQTLGQGLIAYAFAFLPPAFGAITLLIQPVLATAIAWLAFNEAVGGTQAAGIAIVLTGVLLARRGALRS
ncbi:DMT family transporter [Salinisphaera sp. USBA-960]|nr:DMT family transporter [Salifodinibacter halophilus]NNC27113.1 DMT family transporter [Salifodinibacter halophilus]